MNKRHKLGIGATVKVGKITTRNNSNGLPTWSFYVPFMEQRNGELICYDFVQISVCGKCNVKPGDIVRIVQIDYYYSSQYRNQVGGFSVARSLWCEIEKVEKEKKWKK